MWRAGCEETRTPGSGGGPGKRNGRNTVTAPRADLTSTPRSSTRSAAACSKTTVGHRGHKDDPLYKIRGLLRHGVEHLTDKQQAKITACLDAGDPNGEVNLAWQCYQQLRSIYHAGAEQGRTICQKVLDSFPSCPIPEVARLGRTLKAWRTQVLAYFDTKGVSNGGTEVINLIIEKVRRLAHGFRDFEHYRQRILLAAYGQRNWKQSNPCQVPNFRRAPLTGSSNLSGVH